MNPDVEYYYIIERYNTSLIVDYFWYRGRGSSSPSFITSEDIAKKYYDENKAYKEASNLKVCSFYSDKTSYGFTVKRIKNSSYILLPKITTRWELMEIN